MTKPPRPGRFTLLLAALVIAILAASTVMLIWHLRSVDLKHAEGETVSLSHLIAEQTTRTMQSVDLALDIALDRVAEARRLQVPLDHPAMHAMLRARVEVMPQLRSMFIADAQGRIVSSALSHPAPSFNVADRDYFRVQRERPDAGFYIGSPTTNRVDQDRTLFLSRRLSSPDGKFIGVIAASLSISHFEALYRSINLEDLSPIGLFLADGIVVARTSGESDIPPGRAFLPSLAQAGRSPSAYTSVRNENGVQGVTTFRRVSGFPMVVGVGYSDVSALKNWRETAGMIVVAAIGNVIIVIFATGVILRRQQHEAELEGVARQSSEQLAAIVRSAMDAIVTIDRDQRVFVFNPAAQAMFGYSEDQVVGRPLDMLLPERFRGSHGDNILRFRLSGTAARMMGSHMDVIGRRADGREFPIESTIAQVVVDDRPMYTAILRDISERRRADEELRTSYRQLRSLATSLQLVREEERTSIARELHDELGQQLLRLRMDLSWLGTRLRDGHPALHDKIEDMKHFLAGTVDSLRRVTAQLRPPMLDDLGLDAAARWQLDDFAGRTGINLQVRIDLGDRQLDDRIATNVFRILQESLTNVARHAEASDVDVVLVIDNDDLVLEIRDNGRGAESQDKDTLGHGLIGIRERTLMLGGRMRIESDAGSGFALSIRIPLNLPELEEAEHDARLAS